MRGMLKASLWPHVPKTLSAQKASFWDSLSLEDALNALDQKDVLPCADDVICILHECRRRKSLLHAKRVHAHLRQLGLERDGAIGNHMVPTFVECGSLSDAQEVFGRLAHKNVHAWTSLMSAHVESGELQSALCLYEKMQVERVQPSTHTLVAALKACTELEDVPYGQIIHWEAALWGLDGDVFVGSSLVNLYAACGCLEDAQGAFNKLRARNVVTWNALIAGHCTHGSSKNALDLFDRMEVDGFPASSVTYACVLKACGNILNKDKGRAMHAETTMKGLESNVFVGSSLVDMYAKFGVISEASLVFDRLPLKNIVSWNALIAGYGEHGPCEEALKCFERMDDDDISPNASTYACTLKACAGVQDFEKGREIHVKVVRTGLSRDVMVGTSLVDMYAKCGLLLEAHEAFDELPSWTIAAWNALMTGYSEYGPPQKALDCFKKMQSEKVLPDAITYTCILKACGSLGALDAGQDVYLQVLKIGYDSNIFVGSSLVGMYAKGGSLLEAGNVFKMLRLRNAISWNLMIKAFGVNQDGNMAIQYFKDMQEQGITPDTRTFVCLLMACSRAKMFNEGQELLKVMSDSFGLKPSSEHLTCMVDLFARSGFLSEAVKFLESLPSSPSRDMLTALLTACGIHERGDLGLKCFQQLIGNSCK